MIALLHAEDPAIRHQVGLVLSLLGFDVVIAHTASELGAQAGRADLIVVGISAPGGGALSFLAQRRGVPADVPVVAVTGRALLLPPLLREWPDAVVWLGDDARLLRTTLRLAHSRSRLRHGPPGVAMAGERLQRLLAGLAGLPPPLRATAALRRQAVRLHRTLLRRLRGPAEAARTGRR